MSINLELAIWMPLEEFFWKDFFNKMSDKCPKRSAWYQLSYFEISVDYKIYHQTFGLVFYKSASFL